MNYDRVKMILVGGPKDGEELWADDFNVPAVSIGSGGGVTVYIYFPTGEWRDATSMYLAVKDVLRFNTEEEYDKFMASSAPQQDSHGGGASPFGEADCVPT